ncbi:MAG: hypothetical protein PGN09_14295 [Sphingomonas fennica]
MGGVPKVTVLRIADVTDEGLAFAVPESCTTRYAAAAAARDRAAGGRSAALAVGDRILARTEEAGAGFVAIR